MKNKTYELLYDTQAQFNQAQGNSGNVTSVTPGVAYVVESGKTSFNNNLVSFLIQYNVDDISEPTQIYNSDNVKNNLREIIVDKTHIPASAVTNTYQFTETGIHKAWFRYTNFTSIGANAFTDISGSTASLVIPNTVSSIGQLAFRNGGFTGGLTLPDYISSLPNYTFETCHNFTGKLTIPSGVTSIGEQCFDYCSGFTSLEMLPLSTVSIKRYAFRGCSGIRELKLGGPITCAANVFLECTKLKRVDIPSIEAWCKCSFLGPTTSGQPFASSGEGHLYLNGEEVTEVVIPDTITSITSRLFGWCSSITAITIPNTVTKIESNAFDRIGATSITLPSSLTSIGSDIISYTNITAITIPGSVVTLPHYFMDTCQGLQTLILEEGIQTADAYFVGRISCPWTYIDIPSTMVSFGNYAFTKGGENPVIVCRATTPPTFGNNAFYGNISRTLKIYVPYSSDGSILTAYKEAPGWSSKSSAIYELNPDGTIPS